MSNLDILFIGYLLEYTMGIITGALLFAGAVCLGWLKPWGFSWRRAG